MSSCRHRCGLTKRRLRSIRKVSFSRLMIITIICVVAMEEKEEEFKKITEALKVEKEQFEDQKKKEAQKETVRTLATAS